MPKKTDKETKQIIIVAIITLILLIVAIVIYINKNKTIEEIMEPEEVEEIVQETTYKNTKCDMDYTPANLYITYTDYIEVSAIDELGCVLEYSTENLKYISEKTNEAAKIANSKKAMFDIAIDNPSSVRTDQMTIKNSQGNVLGWALLLFYSDGYNNSRYAYKDDKWIQIG